jgi:hypothetical protein
LPLFASAFAPLVVITHALYVVLHKSKPSHKQKLEINNSTKGDLMRKRVLRVSMFLLVMGVTMNLMVHQHLIHTSSNPAASLVGGSKFWVGLACGASVGGLVFAAPTGVLLAAGVVLAIGTCGDAFFG